MNISRLVVLVAFVLALGGVALVVIWAAPLDSAQPVHVATASRSPRPVRSADNLEDPLLAPEPGPSSTAARLWQVAAWSRGSGASLARATGAGALDEIDLDWYHSRPDGSIKTEGEDLKLVAKARSDGVQAFMTVTNRRSDHSPFSAAIAHAILSTPAKAEAHAAQLVAACETKGFDGVDLDWEMIAMRDRDRFSAFVEDLAGRLHAAGKKLAIAVFPKTSEPGSTIGQKGEDYARLGAAVDEFKIMTYSFSGPWSKPGPQAPLAWTSRVLGFAEKRVDPAKIYMGLPFFGFEWRGRTATTTYASDLPALRERYLVKVRRDSASGELRFAYRDARRRLHRGYVVDERALDRKLQMLIRDHPKIAGIAIWVMGDEEATMWQEIRTDLSE